ncbi:MAG: hypothetical protein ABIS28_03175 [Caldimonas sp.]
MTDRIFSAVLTFLLLAGGTFAVGSELLGGTRTAPAKALHAATVTLPKVEVIGHRAATLVALNQATDDTDAGLCLE